MRSAWIVLALLAAALGLFAWQRRAARSMDRPIDTSALERPPAGGAADDGPNQTEIPPAGRGFAALPPALAKPAPSATAVNSIEDRATDAPSDEEFARQYGGWSLERLEFRLNELENEHQLQIDRLCDERFALGLFRAVVSDEIEGPDASYDVLSPSDESGVITRVRTVAAEDLNPAQPIDEDDAGRITYQVVQLPPETFPALYRQAAELEWLRAACAKVADEPPR